MKKFTLIAAAAILAATAAQAAPIPVRKPINAQPVSERSLESRQGKKMVKKSVKRFAPATELAGPTEENNTIVTTAPAGKTAIYAKEGEAWGNDGYEVYLEDETGYVAEIVMTDDNKIYMAPCFSNYTGDKSYLVGDVKDGVATFTFPQAVFSGVYMDDDGLYEDLDYALMMEVVEDEEGYMDLVPSDKQELSFNISEDGVLTPTEEPTAFISAVYWVDGYGYIWDYMGDCYTSLTPITDTPAAMPEGISAEDWVIITDENGYQVKVAVDGSNIYLQGICSILPEGVIAGTLADGKATFPSVNYLGYTTKGKMMSYYAMSTVFGSYEIPDYGMFEGQMADGKEIIMTYDAENGVITLDGNVSFSYVGDYCLLDDMLEKGSTIVKASNEEITAIPAPEIVYYEPFEDDYGSIIFVLNNIISENQIVPTDKLYFSIYLDDEIMTFDPEDYLTLSEPTTMLKYGYVDEIGGAIIYEAPYQLVYYFIEGFSKIGVQTIYKDGDKEIRSEITYIDANGEEEPGDEDGIVNITESNAPATYFDLQGRKISTPAAGQIAIRKSGAKATVVKF